MELPSNFPPLLLAAISDPSWRLALLPFWDNALMEQLNSFVAKERLSGRKIYPPKGQVFTALETTPYDCLKVIIVGQDPYHGERQAHGLAFSVQEGIPLPRSLQNIYLELQDDLGVPPAKSGCLLAWAKQGVLLLNTILTVEDGKPKSHEGRGWENFTDQVLAACASSSRPLIFVLWGKAAQEKIAKIQNLGSHHRILTAPHPSPFSARTGFFGCRHFSQINQLLEEQGNAPIDWRLE